MPQGKINLNVKSQRIAFLDENRFLTKVSRYSTIPSNQVVAYAAQSANVPESAITQAVLAIRDAIIYFICNGHHVDLNKFGILALGIKSKAVVTPEEVSTDAIERLRVRYLPSTQIKQLIEQVELNNV